MSPQRVEASPEPVSERMSNSPRSSADLVDSAKALDSTSSGHLLQNSEHPATLASSSDSAKASSWTRVTTEEDLSSHLRQNSRHPAASDFDQRTNIPSDATIGTILRETRPQLPLQEPRAATEEDYNDHLRQNTRQPAASLHHDQYTSIPSDATIDRILRDTRPRFQLQEAVPEVRSENPNVQEVGSYRVDPGSVLS